MSDTKKYLKMSLATSEGVGGVFTNSPPQYNTQRKQYMAQPTRDFVSLRAEYASDVNETEAQGIDPADFYKFVATEIRFSDVASPTSSKIMSNDDRKEALFFDPHIEYFPLGAKLVTCGSTWICVNPSNISSAYTTAVVRRCNASYNSYDEYGNLITEPIIIDTYAMTGNENTDPDNMVLMDGNFRVICQLNDNTRKLDVNKRIILGTKAYYITGFTDFMQEFSGDRDSVHLLNMTVRLEEPTIDDDITDDYVADADDFVYGAQMSGQNNMTQGQNAQFEAIFTKNGQAVNDLPTTWLWESSDEDVATVDNDGNVSAVGVGTCTIKAVLSQNSGVFVSNVLRVEEAPNEPYIQFVGLISTSIMQWFTESYTAAYFDANGEEQEVPIMWEINGVSKDCYSTNFADDGKTISIECLKSADEPLELTASYGDVSITIEIELYGY